MGCGSEEDCYAEEEIQGGGDCREAAPGRCPGVAGLEGRRRGTFEWCDRGDLGSRPINGIPRRSLLRFDSGNQQRLMDHEHFWLMDALVAWLRQFSSHG